MIKRFSCAILAFIVMFSLISSVSVSALSKTNDYQYDEKLHSIPGPQTFSAKSVLYGNDLGITDFSNPSDIFVDKNENIYIADTGNNRILVFSKDFSLIRTIDNLVSDDGNDTLAEPKGVFAKDGLVFICDTGNFRVVAVNENNEVVRLIKGKDLMSVNKNFVFKPEKVVVDSNNNVLISSSAIYQGILRFDSKDNFKAFFAPNEVTSSFSTFVTTTLKKFFTDTQKESLRKNLPSPYSNLYIDDENFIFATAENVNKGQDMKKLNSSGTNILAYSSALAENNSFGDYESRDEKTSFIDIHCDKDGYILVADSSTQKLFLYDKECSLMSVFGGKGKSRGQFSQISAVEKLGNEYLILDSELGTVTVLSPNAYMSEVLVAMNFYQSGEYEKCEEMWKNILNQNSNFPFAYKSLGRTQYHLGNYKLSMKYLKSGGDTYFYSLALNEYRKELIQDNFALVLGGIVAFIVIFTVAVKRIKKFLLSK